MSQPLILSGRCLCGAVRYQFEGVPLWCAHCHCESCRRQTSAVFASFVGVRSEDIAWSGSGRRRYQSSPGVHRTFCGDCGSPMTYESETRWPGETHLHIGSLDEPNAVAMGAHVHVDEQLSWIEVLDQLPRFGATGSSSTAPLYVGPRQRPPVGSTSP